MNFQYSKRFGKHAKKFDSKPQTHLPYWVTPTPKKQSRSPKKERKNK
jgi:hypothetical protein